MAAEELPFELACVGCGWRAKNPTFFRALAHPVCPSCGQPLQGTTPLSVQKTSWERLLDEVETMAEGMVATDKRA